MNNKTIESVNTNINTNTNLKNYNSFINTNTNLKNYNSFIISEKNYKNIKDFIKSNNLNSKSFFISIFGFIWHKYCNQETIYTSIINNGKNDENNEIFNNIQPLLIDFKNINTFGQFYNDVHSKLSLSDISEISNKLNSISLNNGFIYEPKIDESNYHLSSIFEEKIHHHQDKNQTLFLNQLRKLDLVFRLSDKQDHYLIDIAYNSKLYSNNMIKNIMYSYDEVVKNLNSLNKSISDIEYITLPERKRIIQYFNNNNYYYGENKFYHVEFSRISRLHPDKSALVFENKEFTYRQLDEMSNSLAHYLIRSGVKRNTIVPIICERSYYFVVSSIAIMKAGGAFLYIDPEFPKDRIQLMINEVKAQIVLKYLPDQNNKEFGFSPSMPITVYDLQNHEYSKDIEEISNINQPDDISCLFFTSGTTGKPKGTLISHDNLFNFCAYSQTYNGVKDFYEQGYDNVLAFAKLTFNMSIHQILNPILKDKRVIMCNNDEYNDPYLLGNIIKKYDVEYIISTPSRIRNYMNNDNFKDSIRDVKTILFGGESLNNDFLQHLIKYTNATIYSGYGLTEVTSMCAVTDISPEDIKNNNIITIGRPICNCEVYILDSQLKPVPVGVEGEIYIGGHGVSKGYLNQKELTEEKFLDCPFHNTAHGRKLYKTGDLGRWTEDGKIVHMGRMDFQVKINGQRIELREIENVIKKIQGINDVIVLDKNKKENNDKYLIAYYITNEEDMNDRFIRDYLKDKLPLYMIPKYFLRINEIPINFNGKLDRKALPEPNIDEIINKEYIEPKTNIERKICQIFSKVFLISENKIGMNDNFFELGGDSLNAVTISLAIEKELGTKLNIKDIIEYSTIKDLSRFVENKLLETSPDKLSQEQIIIKANGNERRKEFPLTSQQLGIYLDAIKYPQSIMYNLPSIFKLKENTNLNKVREAFSKLFAKHDILRSKYFEKEINGQTEIYGIIDDECPLVFENYTNENKYSFIRPFNIEKAPLIRVGFVEEKLLLMIDMHHMISDGTSMSIIKRELNQFYHEENDDDDNEIMESSEIQFSDYAHYIDRMKKEGHYDNQIEFYKKMFEKDFDLLNCPKKETNLNDQMSNEIMPNEKTGSKMGICAKFIDKFTRQSVDEYIQKNQMSKTAFFFTIYGYILSKYSGQDVVYTSTMTANRNTQYKENMIGMFINTQPILLNYSQGDCPFKDIIKKNMNTLMDVYNHQDLSFSELSRELKLPKVNNSFIYQPKNIFHNKLENSIFSEKESQYMYTIYLDHKKLIENNNSKFELSVNVIENEEDYLISMDYDTSLYDDQMIQYMMDSFVEVINQFNSFNHPIKEIEYIPKKEKNRILNIFNEDVVKDSNSGNHAFYHEDFVKMAEKQPEKVAVVCGEVKLSYGELDRMSNSLGHYLRENGVERNDIVPVISERSAYYIISTLAINKAGGAFLPIDTKLPKERVQFILGEVKPKLILFYNTYSIIENLKDQPYQFCDLSQFDYEKNSTTPLTTINEPDDTCYVLFTSGTTGKPKGALVSYYNLYHYIQKYDDGKSHNCFYDVIIKESDIKVVLAVANFCFDISHNEMIFSLMHGLTVVLANDHISSNMDLLSEYIIKNNVDFINTTPTRFKLFMENDKFKKLLKNIKLAIFGGEALPLDLCQDIRKHSSCRIYNSYGPTECTVNCTGIDFDKRYEKKVTIGKPLCNCQLYVLDKYLKPVPVGVVGEIFIGGYGVGKGYLNREELTKEKFISCPFNTDNDFHCRTIYRTGDLGRWNENGEIDYLGRIDFQIKIHGQRIEIGEIDSIIKEMKGIDFSAVIDKVKKTTGDKYLICYYKSGNGITGKDIRNYLKQKLPLYMIPNYFKKIDYIPISQTGKLDRKALPEPERSDLILEEYVQPETETEKMICKIYQDIFNMQDGEVGKTSDFLDLGGDSLNAIRVISRIEKEINLSINIKDILNNSPVYKLSELIDNYKNDSNNDINNNNNSKNRIEKRNDLFFPITSQQLGIYIDSIKNSNTTIYNVPISLKLNKSVDISMVKKAFNTIFTKHSILRSKYIEKEINGQIEICGIIDEECQLIFENYTFDNAKSFIRPFKLDEAPLLRVGFIQDEVLLIDAHHIIIDGTSMMKLVEELNGYYNGNEIPEQEIQFSDYAHHLYEMKHDRDYYDSHLEFYKNMFKEIDYDLLNLPKNSNSNKTNTNTNTNKEKEIDGISNVGICSKSMDNSISKFIKDYSHENKISKTALFLTIYGYVLSKYSGQDFIYSSIMSINRSNHYTENMIGMFVSTQPILLKYDQLESSFLQHIQQNMNNLMEMYNHQDLSISDLSSQLKLKPVNNSFVYQPKTLLNQKYKNSLFLQNQNIYSLYENRNELHQNNRSKFDITFNVIEKEDNYTISIDYNTDIYDSDMINRLLDSYIEVIHHLDQFHESAKTIDYITREEKAKIINKFNSDICYENVETMYHEEFSRRAEQCKNKVAIIDSDNKITFDALDKMSNSLAHYLRKCGVGRNDIVPIISDRSYYFIIGTLAISKAGGAFLPIDKKLPIQRIQFILEEVQPKILIFCNTSLVIDNLHSLTPSLQFEIYDLKNHNYEENTESIDIINKPEDTCYVLFTSGTTGKPKGALVSHFNIYNNLRAFPVNDASENHLGLHTFLKRDQVNNILGLTNFSFDISHNEITFSLMHGLTLVLANDDLSEDTKLLTKYILENNVEFINTTPSRFKLFMENKEFCQALNTIKSIVFIGEELPLSLCRLIHTYSNCRIYNGYGPTECTVTCSYKEVDDVNENKITIGRQQCNYQLYILDKYLKPVPVGVEGEIFIGGYGVGKGYLNREALTNEKFIPCPFINDANAKIPLMYRTGDLGKWNENGEIDYLGRIDFQIKVNGQRIELGEIENVINEISGIEHNVVIDKMKENGEKYLICYYITKEMENKEEEEAINGKIIREYLKTKLPIYMIPNYYKQIYELPLSISGKLNRKALPEPDIEDLIQEKYIAPKTELEKSICQIYSRIFNRKENEIGRMSDFFNLGGDSMNAIRLTSVIEKELNIKLSIKDIITHPVIYQLCQYIEERNSHLPDHQISDIILKQGKKEFPITSQQLGVYFDSIKNPNSVIYNIPFSCFLKENIDIEVIKLAFKQLLEKHEILRSRYMEKEEEIYGFIEDHCELEFENYTYENVKSFVRPFDLSKPPLIRVGFINNEVLLVDIHHIISDGSTITIIKNELNQFYYNKELKELDIQFSDYALNRHEHIKNGDYDHQIEFYKTLFDYDYNILNIPKKELKINEHKNNKNSEEIDNYNTSSGVYSKIIDKTTSKMIDDFVKRNEISKTSLFLSVYGYVLSKYTGQDVIYSSIVSSNRNSYAIENMIGMFVGTQPLLLKYDNKTEPFIKLIKQNMNLLLNIYNNQDISYTKLVNSLKLLNVNNTFVYQPKSIYQTQNHGNDSIYNDKNNDDLFLISGNEANSNENNMSKFDMTFNVIEKDENYLLLAQYDQDIYDDKVIERITESINEVLKNVNSFKDKTVTEIEYIPEKDIEKIQKTFNNNEFKYDLNKVYHVEYSRIAKQYPNKPAIICNDIEITFKKLDEMTNSLAHFLRNQNIGKGDIVPILCERSPYYIIGALAVMKSGAAYLPIDPEFPNERINYMVKEANAKLVLKYVTDPEICERLIIENAKDYSLDQHDYNQSITELENVNKGNDICYVLFTSGTTGKPKGTLITHTNLVNYCLYSQTYQGKEDIYGKNLESSIAFSKFTFDMSVAEINYPLLRGATIILCNDEEFNQPQAISSLIEKYHVQYMATVPSRFKNYMKYDEFKTSIKHIKWILFGGEKLDHTILEILKDNSTTEIYNGYGPTEATAMCLCKKVLRFNENINETITVGKPLCNCKTFILDKEKNLVPIGVEGEIYVAGYGVGHGYLNRPKLSQEKFIDCPYVEAESGLPCKMYSTGDLGKWTENGEVICLGRIDFQVKINGQRVELSEIENTVKEMDDIKNSVILDKDLENGKKYLICYYMSDREINNNEIRDFLKNKLPSYMIPNYYVRIYELPVTANGKLDKKALPEPNISELNKEKYVAPETETEKYLCKLFSNIFNKNENELGKTDDFLELGGDSFFATNIMSHIKKELNVNLSIKDIINNSEIQVLANFIDEHSKSENYKIELIKRSNEKEFPYPSDTVLFNMESMINSCEYFQLSDNIDIDKLIKCLNIIFNRHRILKANFFYKNIDGENVPYGIMNDDNDENKELHIEKYTIENFNNFIRPYDIGKDLLVRVGLIDKKVLMIDMVHLVTDGYSFNVLFKELIKLYNDEPLPELPIQFNDYGIYYNKKYNSDVLVKHIDYFKNIFNEPFENISLPKRKDELVTTEDVIIEVDTDFETFNIINETIQKNNLTKTAYFLIIYSLVLSKYSGQNNLFSNLVITNRSNINIENLIGNFALPIPVLVKFKEHQVLIDVIREYMNLTMTVLSSNILFTNIGEQLQLSLPSSVFKFDTINMFDTENKLIKVVEHDDIYTIFNREDILVKKALPRLPFFQFYVIEMKDRYKIDFTFNESLYDRNLIKSIINDIICIFKDESYLFKTIKEISIKNDYWINNDLDITNQTFIRDSLSH
ncbi:acetyl-CoA synthetase-like protein [Anaeromyces robustus]|uniref:Acetyl-CoA synthetase-like protein n=1 Tax=Anaeromyces robustus TaxID=1754192 RepID=A0A1Y1WZW7_9FUNG|nr:acetyl-CoA synthetase-like protein [Anaeromyces robustus]|eukprot:ORX78898.1 acetyl-CoA synthetase-like protein [Anaeromyces robustus]